MGFENGGFNKAPKSEQESGLRPATPEEMNMIQTSLSRIGSMGFKRPHELQRYVSDVLSSMKEFGFQSNTLNEGTSAVLDNVIDAVQRGGDPNQYAHDLPPELFNEAVRLADPKNPNQSMYRHNIPE